MARLSYKSSNTYGTAGAASFGTAGDRGPALGAQRVVRVNEVGGSLHCGFFGVPAIRFGVFVSWLSSSECSISTTWVQIKVENAWVCCSFYSGAWAQQQSRQLPRFSPLALPATARSANQNRGQSKRRQQSAVTNFDWDDRF